jgi:hypothetical protein
MLHPDDHDPRIDPTTPEPSSRREASEAQRAASRANGARSRGPTTPEGRDRSRANALKHGLTGSGEVLMPGMAAEVAAKERAYRHVLRPDDEVQRDLVRRAALASVRLEYCERYEAARLERRQRWAAEDWDDRRAAEVAAAARLFETDPATALRHLRRSVLGAQWQIDRWRELGRAVEQIGHWDEARLDRAVRLLGYAARPDCTVDPPVAELVRHALGAMPEPPEVAADRYFGAPEPREEGLDDDYVIDIGPPPGVSPEEYYGPQQQEPTALDRLPTVERAREYLAAFVADEVRRLVELRDGLGRHLDGADRAAAEEMALFDPSPEAVRLRQYETACQRERSRALADLERLKKARFAAEEPPSRRKNEPGAAAEGAVAIAMPPEVAPAAPPEPAAALDAAARVEPRRENEPGALAIVWPSGPPDDPAPRDEGAPEPSRDDGTTPGG